MLENYLGILIDLNGNFITFGKWVKKDRREENIHFHGRSCLIALDLHDWIDKYPKLNVSYQSEMDLFAMDSDFYELIEDWNKLGFSLFLNWNNPAFKSVVGYFPINITEEQARTILLLESDILWQKNINTYLFVNGIEMHFLTLEQCFSYIKKNIIGQKKRILSFLDNL